MYIYHGQ